MTRIFKYELKRLLFNKFFVGLVIINGLFAWYVLTSDTVAGIAYTAPFSPWSFGAYLASVMPISMITLLFLLTFFHSAKEKQVKALTDATPVNAVSYTLVRNAVVALGFFFVCVLVIGLSVYFYAAYFDYWYYAAFVFPAIVTVIPCFVFTVGIGHCVGRIHPGLLYSLMLLCFACNFVRIPGAFDLFAGEYYASIPLSLPVGVDGEPAFTLNAAFLVARAFYLVVGIVLFALSLRPSRRIPLQS